MLNTTTSKTRKPKARLRRFARLSEVMGSKLSTPRVKLASDHRSRARPVNAGAKTKSLPKSSAQKKPIAKAAPPPAPKPKIASPIRPKAPSVPNHGWVRAHDQVAFAHGFKKRPKVSMADDPKGNHGWRAIHAKIAAQRGLRTEGDAK